MFSTEGPGVTDWAAAFERTDPDRPGSLDGVHDRPDLPVDSEPDQVRADLRRFDRRS